METFFGGGFYSLIGVQQYDEDTTWKIDIYLLTDCIKDDVHRELLCACSLHGTSLWFSNIKQSITGWARFIVYRELGEDLILDSIFEGQFKDGQKHGYIRGISAVNGYCTVGIHEDN